MLPCDYPAWPPHPHAGHRARLRVGDGIAWFDHRRSHEHGSATRYIRLQSGRVFNIGPRWDSRMVAHFARRGKV